MGATSGFEGECGESGAPDMAYAWEAPSTDCYRFDTEGSGFDTVLRVFSDCSIESSCDDDGAPTGLTSRIQVSASAGEAFILVIDGFSASDFGDFVLNIESCEVEEVYSSGSFTVEGTFRGDLDEGGEGESLPDFWWQLVSPVERNLVPAAGAAMAVMGPDPVSFLDCTSVELSEDAIDGSGGSYGSIPIGTHLCARTDEGRFSTFEITDIDPDDNHRMYLSYTTWAL
jgi:hypothetical protein